MTFGCILHQWPSLLIVRDRSFDPLHVLRAVGHSRGKHDPHLPHLMAICADDSRRLWMILSRLWGNDQGWLSIDNTLMLVWKVSITLTWKTRGGGGQWALAKEETSLSNCWRKQYNNQLMEVEGDDSTALQIRIKCATCKSYHLNRLIVGKNNFSASLQTQSQKPTSNHNIKAEVSARCLLAMTAISAKMWVWSPSIHAMMLIPPGWGWREKMRGGWRKIILLTPPQP